MSGHNQDIANDGLLDQLEKNLPHPPAIVLATIRLIRDDSSDFNKLTSIIRNDPGFVTMVVKYANRKLSAAGKDPVDSLKRATEVLGFDRLKRIALSVSVFKVMDIKQKTVIFDIERFWRLSFATAVAAQYLCANNTIEKIKGDIGFAAGIIANIGKLYLVLLKGNDYALELLGADGGILSSNSVQIERNFFKGSLMDHCVFGERIGTRFGFPPEFINAIRFHHDYRNIDNHDTLTKIIILSRMIALIAYSPPDANTSLAMNRILGDMKTHLGMEYELSRKIINIILKEVPVISRLFNIEIGFSHEEILKDVMQVKFKILKEIRENKEYQQFITQPEIYLPNPVSQNLLSINGTHEFNQKLHSSFSTAELLFTLMGLLGVIHFEHNKLVESKPYLNFVHNWFKPMSLGSWANSINSFLDFIYDKDRDLYVAPEFGRINSVKKEIGQLIALRNSFMHKSGAVIGRDRMRELFSEIEMYLHKILSQSFVFFYGFFFYVIDTKFTRGADIIYTVKKWQGPLEESLLAVEEIRTPEKLIQETDIYFYDCKTKAILRCFPYLFREKHKQTGDHSVFIFEKSELGGKTFHYRGARNDSKVKRSWDSPSQEDDDVMSNEEFILSE